jgi:hypothetical protein
MPTNLARPTTGLGSGVYGSTASAVISASGTEFAIKAFSVDLAFQVPVVEVTGSSDTAGAATFITGKTATCSFKITGAMVVSAALGIAKLRDQDTVSGTDDVTLTPDAMLTIDFGGDSGNNFTNARCYIESIQIQHQVRQGAIVGVVLSGRMSGVTI